MVSTRALPGAFAVLMMACGPGEVGSGEPATGATAELDAGADAGTSGADVDATVAPVDAGRRADAEAAVDAGPATNRVWVAAGAMGRTLRSCDEGRTWLDDSDFASGGDPTFCGDAQDHRCSDGERPLRWSTQEGCRERDRWNCDHNPGSSMGLQFHDGRFVATFGWGAGIATTRVSDDGGATWRVTRSEPRTFNRLYSIGGRLLLMSPRPIVSLDGGESWTDATNPELGGGIWNIRGQGLVPHEGGQRLWMLGMDRNTALAFTDDGGDTWESRPVPPTECIEANGKRFVRVGDSLRLTSWTHQCISRDEGLTWEVETWEALDSSSAREVYTDQGRVLVYFSSGVIATTEDGETWETHEVERPRGRVFRLAEGRWVLLVGNAYEGYGIWRSSDGIRYVEDSAAAVPPGHPIRQLAQGVVASEHCR